MTGSDGSAAPHSGSNDSSSEKSDSVSEWIEQARQGEDDAASELWNRYFHDLVRLARDRLSGHPRTYADEEDVALNAMNCFFESISRGRHPDLRDRESLWRLLSEITRRKAVDLIRYHHRKKRANQTSLGEYDVFLKVLTNDEIANELTSSFSEEVKQLFAALNDPILATIALAKLEGHTNQELARIFDSSLRTVERRLSDIRQIWLDLPWVADSVESPNKRNRPK